MNYTNLIGLVILTIIIVFVVHTAYIHTVLAQETNPVYHPGSVQHKVEELLRSVNTSTTETGTIREGVVGGSGSGITMQSLQTPPTPIQNCIVTPEMQKILNKYKITYQNCNNVYWLLNSLRILGLYNVSDILGQASQYTNLKTCEDINQALMDLYLISPNSWPAFNVMFILLNYYSTNTKTKMQKLFRVVKEHNLDKGAGTNRVLPSGHSSDNRSLLNSTLAIGVNLNNLEEMLYISRGFGILNDVNSFYTFLYTIGPNSSPRFGFVYYYMNYVELLRLLLRSNTVKSNPGCSGSQLLIKTCSLIAILDDLGTSWPTFIYSKYAVGNFAGYQADFIESVKSFRTWWKTNATSDKEQPGAKQLYEKITDTTDWIHNMMRTLKFINNKSGVKYFHCKHGRNPYDLKTFWDVAIRMNYSIYRIVEDGKIGGSAYKFVTKHSIVKSGFEPMNYSISDSISDSISGFFENIKSTIFGREGMALNAAEGSPDQLAIQKFGITSGSQLAQFEPTIIPYVKNTFISSSNSDWDNMLVLMDAMQKAGVTITNWDQYLELMEDFKATVKNPNGTIQSTNTVQNWVDVFNTLARLDITEYTKAEEFLGMIMDFGVYYNDLFKEFVDAIEDFEFKQLNSNFKPLGQFIDDMNYIGYQSYKSNPTNINAILKYFAKRHNDVNYENSKRSNYKLFSFPMYATKDPQLLGGTPSQLVRSLYEYGKDKYAGNALKDILLQEKYSLLDIEVNSTVGNPWYIRESITNCIRITKGKVETSSILSQIKMIVSFLTKRKLESKESPKEIDKIIDKMPITDDEIVDTIRSISGGLLNYIKIIMSKKLKTQNEMETVESLSDCIIIMRAFPFTVFQCIADYNINKIPTLEMHTITQASGAIRKNHHRPNNGTTTWTKN